MVTGRLRLCPSGLRKASAMVEAVAQGSVGGVVAAHTVNPAAGWGGGGAQVQPWHRRGIRNVVRPRTREELPEVLRPTTYVAPDQVGVLPLKPSGRRDTPSEYPLPKTGGEPLHLRPLVEASRWFIESGKRSGPHEPHHEAIEVEEWRIDQPR